MQTELSRYSVGRSANVTLDKIQERKEFIISLCLAGMTNDTILKQVNIMSDQMQWGQLHSIRSIERTIAGHFNDDQRMSLEELRSYQSGLREAAFAQQAMLIEKAVLHVHRKKEWVPFEYVSALYKIFKMMQMMVDNRGWNYSKLPAKRMVECGYEKPRRVSWKSAWRSYEMMNRPR